MTASTLRTIDKVGGLDQYLLKSSLDPVLGQYGQKLKLQILEARAAKQDAAMLQQFQDSMPKSAADLFGYNKSNSTTTKARR